MSQQKMDEYKKDKANRKNWKKERNLKRAIGIVAAVVCVALIGVAIYFIANPSYDYTSKWDDACVAAAVGYTEVNPGTILSNEALGK